MASDWWTLVPFLEGKYQGDILDPVADASHILELPTPPPVVVMTSI